jgi:hypothetical protein
MEAGLGEGGGRAPLVSDRSLGRFLPFPTFLFWKVFSSHEFLLLEYHNLCTQLWCITSTYNICQMIFKHKFDSS